MFYTSTQLNAVLNKYISPAIVDRLIFMGKYTFLQ